MVHTFGETSYVGTFPTTPFAPEVVFQEAAASDQGELPAKVRVWVLSI